MSLLQGGKTKSRKTTLFSFSASNGALCENIGSFLIHHNGRRQKEFEDIEKPDISKRPLHHCGSSRFLCASAKVLRE
jgi:hypothetical protein